MVGAPVDEVFDMVAGERNEPRYYPRIVRAEKTSEGPFGGRSSLLTTAMIEDPRVGTGRQRRVEPPDLAYACSSAPKDDERIVHLTE